MKKENYDFFGLSLHVRTENRGGVETMIVSLWSSVGLSLGGKPLSVMLMESAPMRVSKLKKDIKKFFALSKKEASGALENADNTKVHPNLYDVAVLRFMAGKFTSLTAKGEEISAREKEQQRQREMLLGKEELPLAAVIAIFWKDILDERSTRDGKKKKREAMLTLLACCGDIPWREALPGPCMERLEQKEYGDKDNCRILMKEIRNCLLKNGIEAIKEWDEYILPDQEPPASSEKRKAMHIDKKMFTEGEAREIIKSCLEGTTHTGVRILKRTI